MYMFQMSWGNCKLNVFYCQSLLKSIRTGSKIKNCTNLMINFITDAKVRAKHVATNTNAPQSSPAIALK